MVDSDPMAVRRRLRNPPITEAVVDLRATPTKPLGAETLANLKKALGGRYPEARESREFVARLQVKRGHTPIPSGEDRGLHGYVLKSADGHQVAQFRVDGFTYNRLKPYTDGDAVLQEALDLWRLYVELAAPLLVNRVALRYLNQIDVPGTGPSYGQYLTSSPHPPEGLRGALQSFLSRYVVNDFESGIRAIMTLASQPAVDRRGMTILIDIDAFKVADCGIAASDILPSLRALREFKNEAFFGAVTEEAVRMWE